MRGVLSSRIYVADSYRDSVSTYFEKYGVTYGDLQEFIINSILIFKDSLISSTGIRSTNSLVSVQ